MEIDETFNAVELEKAGNTDKSIPLSKSNQLTESLGIRKEKLSKIYLKKFCGDPISFNTFWESFASAVDDNPSLSDGDKFNYLKNMLEGSAAGGVRGLTLTAENYEKKPSSSCIYLKKYKVYKTSCPANSYNANLGRTRL